MKDNHLFFKSDVRHNASALLMLLETDRSNPIVLKLVLKNNLLFKFIILFAKF